ncbi:hypothetical protein FACS1894142_2990 [Spirochaetia bacterium]|nr:hypothetical protein FACS1894142_2990 [Spirochaetia bacterium]
MYLGSIEDRLKERVLDLAFLIANSDSNYSDSEKFIIENYEQEMRISYTPRKRELEEILNSLSSANSTDKRKILLEMVALVVADGEYSIAEQTLLKKISGVFNIEEGFLTDAVGIVDDMNILYLKASKLIKGDA